MAEAQSQIRSERGSLFLNSAKHIAVERSQTPYHLIEIVALDLRQLPLQVFAGSEEHLDKNCRSCFFWRSVRWPIPSLKWALRYFCKRRMSSSDQMRTEIFQTRRNRGALIFPSAIQRIRERSGMPTLLATCTVVFIVYFLSGIPPMPQEAGGSQAKQHPPKTPFPRCRQVIETAQAVQGYFYPSKTVLFGGSFIPLADCAIL